MIIIINSPPHQRVEFLRAALAEVCKGQMDEVEQMKQCLEVLRRDESRERESEEDVEEEEDEREDALEVLSELCENLDNARGGCVFMVPHHSCRNVLQFELTVCNW